jgi:putative transposase
MLRKTGIDAPGALHHVIGRGIARGEIFLDDADRNDFLGRLGAILIETRTTCYAWVLISNHFHLLLRTGSAPLSSVMRRLLTGYAATSAAATFSKTATNPSCVKKIFTFWNWSVTST